MRRWWRTRSATVKTMPAFCAFSHKAGFSRRVPEVWLTRTIKGCLTTVFFCTYTGAKRAFITIRREMPLIWHVGDVDDRFLEV